jgi:hypothetical protein
MTKVRWHTTWSSTPEGIVTTTVRASKRSASLTTLTRPAACSIRRTGQDSRIDICLG